MDSGADPGVETQQEAGSGCGEARDLKGVLRDKSRGQLVIGPGAGLVGGLPGGKESAVCCQTLDQCCSERGPLWTTSIHIVWDAG